LKWREWHIGARHITLS